MIILLGALVIGVTLGLMGSGGSVLTVPVLTYLLDHDGKVAMAESLAIVGTISVFSAIPYARQREVDWRCVALFGIPGMVGTFLGAWLAAYVSTEFQLILFGLVVIAAATLMLRSKEAGHTAPSADEGDSMTERANDVSSQQGDDAADAKVHSVHARPHKQDPRSHATHSEHAYWLIGIEGIVVGIITGIVGVGGGFMIVPALVLLVRVPIRVAIGTSLVIIALKSSTGLIKYLQVLDDKDLPFHWDVVGVFVLVGVVGSLMGHKIGERIKGRLMKQIFAAFLLAIAAFVLVREAPSLLRSAEAQEPDTPVRTQDRPERVNMMRFQDEAGQWHPVKNADDWQVRRDSIVAAMQTVMGPLPDDSRRCELDIELIEEEDCGDYVRRLITYESEPGSRVPAYLLIPKTSANDRAPAMLCLHPTDNQVGHQVVVGLGGRPNRQYAEELAQRGYVTLAPAYPLLANYQPDLDALGYQSGTMKAIWDNMRGVDLLQSLDMVDPNSIGAIGHSLGGHNSVYTAVFDSRLRVVVSSCGLDSFVDYKDGDIRGWTSERYMPKLLEYRETLEQVPFDFHELIAALAPRHCLIIAPLHDSNFKWDSVDRIVEAAQPVYDLYDSTHHLRVEHPDCAHDFPPEWREAAYEFIDEVLRRQ